MCRVGEDGGEALRGGLVALCKIDCVEVLIVQGEMLFGEGMRVGDRV